MSSKYEREIEEILRNMDHTEPKSTMGDRVRAFQRPRPPRQGPSFSPVSLSLALLLISLLCLLAALGIAFYQNTPSILSGAFGVATFVAFLLAMIVGWRDQFRATPMTTTATRRPLAPLMPFADDGGAEDAAPRPIRRSLLDGARTRLRLMRLRNRYRQSHEE